MEERVRCRRSSRLRLAAGMVAGLAAGSLVLAGCSGSSSTESAAQGMGETAWVSAGTALPAGSPVDSVAATAALSGSTGAGPAAGSGAPAASRTGRASTPSHRVVPSGSGAAAGSASGSPAAGAVVRPSALAAGLFFGGGPSLYPTRDNGGQAQGPFLLRPVATAVSRAGNGCEALATAGRPHRCGTASTGTATLAWLDETTTSADGRESHAVSVWRATGAGSPWTEMLALPEADAASVVGIDVAQVALPDGSRQLVVQYGIDGTGAILDVDLVAGDGRVASSFGVYKGSLTIGSDGRLVAQYPIYAPDDANCCPSLGRGRATLVWSGGSWRFSAVTPLAGPG